MLFKINLDVFFLPNVVFCCCILYNMILKGKDSDIDKLMTQLKLKIDQNVVHSNGHRKCIKDCILVENITTTNNVIELQGCEILKTNQHILLE